MKKIVITDRDKEIIQFLKDFKAATTTTISNLFFNSSIRPCQRRLKFLTEHGHIRSYQENVITEKIHYLKRKPTNLKHALILSDFIAKLKMSNIEILKYKVPYKLDNIIADAFIAVRVASENRIYFVEVENTKKFNLEKYEKLYYSRVWKDVFPIFPSILVITDRKVNKNNYLNITAMKLDLSDLDVKLK